jgi:hypothetical protein
MRKEGANREQVIARLAATQHGVVAARQLSELEQIFRTFCRRHRLPSQK